MNKDVSSPSSPCSHIGYNKVVVCKGYAGQWMGLENSLQGDILTLLHSLSYWKTKSRWSSQIHLAQLTVWRCNLSLEQAVLFTSLSLLQILYYIRSFYFTYCRYFS